MHHQGPDSHSQGARAFRFPPSKTRWPLQALEGPFRRFGCPVARWVALKRAHALVAVLRNGNVVLLETARPRHEKYLSPCQVAVSRFLVQIQDNCMTNCRRPNL